MDSNSNLFGHRLRAIIERRGFAFDAFAKQIGISRATLYNWFDRDAAPPSRRLQKLLVSALGESEDYVLHGEQVPNKTGQSNQGRAVLQLKDYQTREKIPLPEPMPPVRSSRKEPTREDCERHLKIYLDQVEKHLKDQKFGFRYCKRQLDDYMPLSDWNIPEEKD